MGRCKHLDNEKISKQKEYVGPGVSGGARKANGRIEVTVVKCRVRKKDVGKPGRWKTQKTSNGLKWGASEEKPRWRAAINKGAEERKRVPKGGPMARRAPSR